MYVHNIGNRYGHILVFDMLSLKDSIIVTMLNDSVLPDIGEIYPFYYCN